MSKTVRRNQARDNNQLHRGRRLTRGERREAERMLETSLAPIVGFVYGVQVNTKHGGL